MVVASRQICSSSCSEGTYPALMPRIAIINAAGPQVNRVVCRIQGRSACRASSRYWWIRFCIRIASPWSS